MKNVKSCHFVSFFAVLCLFVAGCVTLQPGAESWYHRIGRVSAEIVLGNNPAYIPDVEQKVEEGLALVTGENVDPVKVLDGINDFAAKLLEEDYEKYHIAISEVLSFMKDLYAVNIEIPENKQTAAENIKDFLFGVKEGLNFVMTKGGDIKT